MITVTSGIKVTNNAVADPDLELRGDPGFLSLALPAFLLSAILSFFTQNREGEGGAAPPPGSSRRSATAMYAEKG